MVAAAAAAARAHALAHLRATPAVRVLIVRREVLHEHVLNGGCVQLGRRRLGKRAACHRLPRRRRARGRVDAGGQGQQLPGGPGGWAFARVGGEWRGRRAESGEERSGGPAGNGRGVGAPRSRRHSARRSLSEGGHRGRAMPCASLPDRACRAYGAASRPRPARRARSPQHRSRAARRRREVRCAARGRPCRRTRAARGARLRWGGELLFC